jgi:PAS domain S-box-containing protein
VTLTDGNTQGGSRPSRVVASVASIWAIAVGGLALLGYGLDTKVLARPVLSGVVMLPDAALAVIAAGAALWLIAPAPAAAAGRRRGGQVLGLLVAVLAATVLAEYVTGRSAGIDLVLFPGRVRAWDHDLAPGRPSPWTAGALLLTGLSLALLDADPGHGHRPARVLVPATALGAFAALLGYAFGVSNLRQGTAHADGLALGSVMTFVVLATGIVACRPDRTTARVFAGLAPVSARQRYRLPVIVAALLSVFLLVAIGSSSLASDQGVTITIVATAALVALYLLFSRAEAALDRASLALRDERDFSATVLRSLREGVLTTGPDGEVLQVNPSWCEITGFAAADVVGRRPPFPWWAPGDVADLGTRLAGILASDCSSESDVRLRRRDGTDVEVLTTSVPVRDNAGVRMMVATYRDLTERNQAEAQVLQAAQQLDHFFDLSTDLLCIAGTDGYFKRLNPAWEQTLGYSVEDLLARPFLDFVHPEDASSTGAELARQGAGDTLTVAFDNRYRCRDGSYRWLSWSATSVVESGTIYAVARDTTEQRRAEQAQESLLAAIVDGSNDAIIGKNLAGTIISWNRAAERIYGYRAAEAIGQPIGLIAPPDRAGEMEDILAQVSRGAPVSFSDTVRLRNDGVRLHVGVTVSPVRDSDGTVVGAASIARDITDRVKAEQRFRRLVQNAPDAMVFVDAAGTIGLVNEQTERLFGYSSAELVGQPVEMLISPGARARHARHRDGYFAEPVTRRMGEAQELSGVRRDGTEFPIEVSLAPVDTDEGTVASAAIRDISGRKQVERALAAARDEALAATRLKSQFVAMVSHEIRTPMNGVIGLTGLLLDTPLKPAQRRYADAIAASGRALLAIISDILDFSKVEAGKISLVSAAFDPGELVQSAAQVAAETGRDKDLEIGAYYPPELPAAVLGDEGRLRQVLLNLVGNAVKFTERGEVVIRVTPAPSEPGGTPRVTFAVTDTGIGIAPDDLPLLFAPFSQVDAAASRRFGGTGLGLSIARQLIELMGGQLTVQSQPGQGSRFAFTLPLPLAPEPALPARFPAASCLSGRRLLIAEHHRTSRQLLSEHARAWGMDTTAVPDDQTALRCLREAAQRGQPYDAAVIDQHTAALAGTGVIQEIIADPVISATKLILVTSGSYRDDETAAAAGATVLTTPVGPSQLYNCLLRLCGPAATADRATPSAPRKRRGPDRGLILLAEDNEINQMVAAENLAALGYRADIAGNGREAVRLATSGVYQAILMDCQMPRMDGYAATAEIRSRERPGQHVPIIAMTAGALAEDRQRCVSAGMDDYLAKPIDPALLSAALRRWKV